MAIWQEIRKFTKSIKNRHFNSNPSLLSRLGGLLVNAYKQASDMISISKTCFSLKIDILIHNWASKKICSIRYTQYLCFLFWKSRKWLFLRPQNSTRSRPPKAADFFGSFFSSFAQSIPGSPKENIHILSISNGTYFFQVQLCINISIFNAFCEFSNFLPDCH